FYAKPYGVCTLSAGKVHGCSCTYGSEPVVLVNNGYSIDAVCAPGRCRSYADCPPRLTVSACADGICYLTCQKLPLLIASPLVGLKNRILYDLITQAVEPRGVCTYNNGAMTGCFCTAYRADPVVHIQNGYSTGAICAPRTRFLTCPSAQMLRTDSLITYVKIDGRCYVSCTGNRNCPWPSRCENNAVLGEVCFYPQWTD
ncbi:hypothetical protein FOL47_007463, partial [Perkinsus chesapeaki]